MKLFGKHIGHGHPRLRHGEPGESHHGRGHHAQGHGHGMRGGGGGRRMFEQGGLRLVLLHLIGEKPGHGYELIKAIEDRFNGEYSPSPGVVYPTLTLLEELGYTSVDESVSGRKCYTITETGKEHLATNRETTDAMLARMNGSAREGAGVRPPQVVRALENFKLALRMRLSRGKLTDEQAHELAAVLDAAAQNLERI